MTLTVESWELITSKGKCVKPGFEAQGSCSFIHQQFKLALMHLSHGFNFRLFRNNLQFSFVCGCESLSRSVSLGYLPA